VKPAAGLVIRSLKIRRFFYKEWKQVTVRRLSFSEALFSIALASAAFLAAIRADGSTVSQSASYVSKACCVSVVSCK
jgi:hypothetical protein